MSEEEIGVLRKFVDEYVQVVSNGFESRWSQVNPDIYTNQLHESIGGLLARQATLAIEFAYSPNTWNQNVAPLFLRCMVDAYITLAWILEEPIDRALKYVLYGLGQEKLLIEYFEQEISENPDNEDVDFLNQIVMIKRSWLERQRASWAAEVNVGSWAGENTRNMANSIGRDSIYRFAYVPFSCAVHNMWNHVGNFNVESCGNPLHKYHLVPKIHRFPIEPDFLYRSAKYISLTYEVFDEKLGTSSNIILPEDYFLQHELFSSTNESDHEGESTA